MIFGLATLAMTDEQ